MEAQFASSFFFFFFLSTFDSVERDCYKRTGEIQRRRRRGSGISSFLPVFDLLHGRRAFLPRVWQRPRQLMSWQNLKKEEQEKQKRESKTVCGCSRDALWGVCTPEEERKRQTRNIDLFRFFFFIIGERIDAIYISSYLHVSRKYPFHMKRKYARKKKSLLKRTEEKKQKKKTLQIRDLSSSSSSSRFRSFSLYLHAHTEIKCDWH